MIYTLPCGKTVDLNSNHEIALLTREEYLELLKVVMEVNKKRELSKQ